MVQLATKFPAKHANEMWFEAGEMYERRTPRLDYARDTLANVGVSLGSIFFWGTLSWILTSVVFMAYRHRLYEIP